MSLDDLRGELPDALNALTSEEIWLLIGERERSANRRGERTGRERGQHEARVEAFKTQVYKLALSLAVRVAKFLGIARK